MFEVKTHVRIAAFLAIAFASTMAQGPRPLIEGLDRPDAKPSSVVFLYPEQITIPAGKPITVTLHFRVAPGQHINSHTPAADELIPTVLTIPSEIGVQLISAVYPPGAEFALPLDPTTKLSVYSGEFSLQARIKATPGNHLVEARLRYQACENNVCMPPKTIPVAIDVLGK
jgi:DsbC/DsbD-like thiol-disulfide interchange protein